MSKLYFSRLACIAFIVFIFSSAFSAPQTSPKPLPAIPELIAKARANQGRILKFYDQFTYEVTHEFDNNLGSDDPIANITVDKRKIISNIQFYRGYAIGETVSDDHSSSVKSITFEQRKAYIDKLINDKLQKGKTVTAQDGYLALAEAWGKDILSILKFSLLTDLRRDVINDRPCFVLNINRAPNGKYGNEGFVKKWKGQIWIDEQSLFVMKIDLSGTWKFKHKDGKTIEVSGFPTRTREQMRVCDDLWLPSNARGGLRVSNWKSDDFIETTYSNYQHKGQPLICNSKGLLQLQ